MDYKLLAIAIFNVSKEVFKALLVVGSIVAFAYSLVYLFGPIAIPFAIMAMGVIMMLYGFICKEYDRLKRKKRGY